MRKSALITLAALPLAFAAAATAQTSTQSSAQGTAQTAQSSGQSTAQSSGAMKSQRYTEIDDEKLVITDINMSVGQIEDMDVMGADGEKIGEIEDVLADESGNPVAVSVETEGFLGMGSEDVIVTFDKLQFVGDKAVTKLTEKELEALPLWDD